MDEIVIGKTASRQVLGVMGEFAFMMQHNRDRSLLDLSLWLSQTPVKQGYPDQMTREAFGRKAKLGRFE